MKQSGDAKTLQDTPKAYIQWEGSMKLLAVSLLSSDEFVYRPKLKRD